MAIHSINTDLSSFDYPSNNSISNLTKYGALILTITTTIVALVRFYLLQNLIIPRLYSARTLGKLSNTQRRSFANHHVAAILKIVLLATAIYPLLGVLSGRVQMNTPLSKGSHVTAGDMFIVSTQIFTAMYLFELLYRDEISPISCAHHIGAIVIAQSAVAMSWDPQHRRDALYELLLCFLWGAFDVIAEFWPHVAMIFYRTHNSDHRFLAKLFYGTMWLELFGTLTETIVMMVLFGLLWREWSLPLKIATPLLHTLFSAAQLWGAWILYKLGKGERSKARDEELLGTEVYQLTKEQSGKTDDTETTSVAVKGAQLSA